jgi:hypothetical protein
MNSRMRVERVAGQEIGRQKIATYFTSKTAKGRMEREQQSNGEV